MKLVPRHSSSSRYFKSRETWRIHCRCCDNTMFNEKRYWRRMITSALTSLHFSRLPGLTILYTGRSMVFLCWYEDCEFIISQPFGIVYTDLFAISELNMCDSMILRYLALHVYCVSCKEN
jgi:hypothetical protein